MRYGNCSSCVVIAMVVSLAGNALLADDPQVVPVGKGSYASFPPNPDPKLSTFLKADIHVDPSMKGKPYPTNKWWTDLLNNGFSGNIWAYPLVIQPLPGGVNIYYPTTWDSNGHDMEKGDPILVSGKVKADASPKSVVLADFEGDSFPYGWRTEGTAFGDGPSQGEVPGETKVSDYMGKGLANSCHDGDQSKGTLSSPHFMLEKPYIHFLIAGGNQPDALYLSLEVDGKLVRKETGSDSEQLKWKTWNVAEFQGHDAQLVAVDNSTGGWGHILFDQVIASTLDKPPLGSDDAFTADDAVAAGWGDWTVKMRLKQGENRVMDATFGRGLPYVWFETKGMTPQLNLASGATVLNDVGQPVTLPATGAHLIIKQGDRLFAVFAPGNSQWSMDGSKITVNGVFGAPPPFLIVAGLPDIRLIGTFAHYAYSVPRNSRFDFKYDPVGAKFRPHGISICSPFSVITSIRFKAGYLTTIETRFKT